MEKKKVIRLLELLGVENINADADEWVRASCPFAPVKHHSKKDSRPSFGVHVGKKSYYNCFACPGSGSLPMLVSNVIMMTGEDNVEARAFLMKHEDLSLEDYDYHEAEEPLSILSEEILKKFAPITAKHPFLRKRGITTECIKRFGLRYDPVQNRMILPIRNGEGRLVGVRGRALFPDAHVKYRSYTELSPNRSDPKGHGIWFGQQFPADPGKKLILVEGELDVISLWKATKRNGIWASMGASLPRRQIKMIQAQRHPIVLFFDDDTAGHEANRAILRKLRNVTPSLHKVRDYQGCKDPDEIVRKGKLAAALKTLDKCD